jgi:hypothetical protein
MKLTPSKYKDYVVADPLFRDFHESYSKWLNFRELDYKLFWKSCDYLSIFDVTMNRQLYKKNSILNYYVKLLSLEQRYIFVLRWLGIFIRSCFNPVSFKYSLLPGFTHFFMCEKKKSVFYKIRLKIYKLKLLQH